jgi:hypothetical protein
VCSNHGLTEISILIVIVHPKMTLIVLLGFQVGWEWGGGGERGFV